MADKDGNGVLFSDLADRKCVCVVQNGRNYESWCTHHSLCHTSVSLVSGSCNFIMSAQHPLFSPGEVQAACLSTVIITQLCVAGEYDFCSRM